MVWLALLASNFIQKGYFVSSTVVYVMAAICLIIGNNLKKSRLLDDGLYKNEGNFN